MLVGLEEMKDFLGEDSDDTDTNALIQSLMDSAEEDIKRSTGVDWSQAAEKETACMAQRVTVWINFYAVRDAAKNTEFLERYRIGLLTKLQYGREADAQT